MSLYSGVSALVTGGTGYFGGAFVRHLLNNGVERVVVYSRDEYKQYRMSEVVNDSRVVYVIGDIRDLDVLRCAVRGCGLVIHASALKHVPSCEKSPSEAVKTNIIGAMNVVSACEDAGVEKVIALSTDKAVYPINAMGCSKMMAEKVFMASSLDVSVVRYGNVINSRGSFVEALIDGRFGKCVPITDVGMTRFMMAIQDAMWLVDSGYVGDAGLYVRKCVSAKVVDMAEAVVGDGFSFNVVGERGGQKLHEVLMTIEESRRAIDIGEAYFVPKGEGGAFNGEGFLMSSDKYIVDGDCVKEFMLEKGVLNV